MKKNLIFIIFSMGFLVLLMGCLNLFETESRALHPLFSTDEDKYLLFIAEDSNIGDNDWGDWLDKNKLFNVNTIISGGPLAEVNEQYKFLELEKAPAFVVFDNKGMVYKTYDKVKLVDFLKSE